MTCWPAFIRFHEKQPLISILSAFPVHPASRRQEEFAAKGGGRIDEAGSSGTSVSFQINYSNNKILGNVPILANSSKSRETGTPFSNGYRYRLSKERKGSLVGEDRSIGKGTRDPIPRESERSRELAPSAISDRLSVARNKRSVSRS